MNFFEMIKPALESCLAVILTAVFSYIGLEVKKLYKRFADTQEKKEIVESTVKYVEQVWYELDGNMKLSHATDRASELLKKKGLDVEPDELRTMIEAAVQGLKGNAGA